MAFNLACSSNCGDIELIPMPESCELNERFTTPSRLLFFGCDVELEDPIKGTVGALFTSGQMVLSSPMANWEFPEPNMIDRATSACEPASQIVTYREIRVQDRYGVTISEGSPAEENRYAEYAFYKNILSKAKNLYAAIVHCNGDVFLPKLNYSKTLVKASIMGYTSYERIDEVSGMTAEFKQFTLRFQGDPFSFNEPDFNLFDEGVSF